MKINGLNNALNVYKNNKVEKNNSSTVSNVSNKKNNSDTIQISNNYEMNANIDKLSKTVAGEVENLNSKERLNDLRDSIKNNSYNVASSVVADNILNRYL